MAALTTACSDGADTTATPTPSATPSVTALSRAAIKAAPASVTITCANAGTTTSTKVVATSPTGVQVKAVNATAEPRLIGYRIVPASEGADVIGSIEPVATKQAKSRVYALPPGRMEVRCGRSANTGLDDVVTLTIIDRDQYYNAIDVKTVLGCDPTPLSPEKSFTDRSTRSDALDLMIGKLPTPGTYTVSDGPGYNGGPVTQHLILRDGKGYGLATVTLLPNLAYRPALTATC